MTMVLHDNLASRSDSVPVTPRNDSQPQPVGIAGPHLTDAELRAIFAIIKAMVEEVLATYQAQQAPSAGKQSELDTTCFDYHWDGNLDPFSD